MNSSLFRRCVVDGLKYILFFFVLFLLGRFLFLISYANFEELKEQPLGVLRAFEMGSRFDVSTLCYGFLPLLLMWLISFFIPQKRSLGFLSFYHHFAKYFLIFLGLLFLSLIIIDFFFYRFFQTRIDVVFFGVIFDDTQAVLSSVWTDYPVVKVIFLFCVFVILFLLFSKYVRKQSLLHYKKQVHSSSSWLFLLILPLYFIGMRGSLGLFPLQREHTNVSNNAFINNFCYNPFYSLKYAYQEFKQNNIEPDIDWLLRFGDFKDIKHAQQTYQTDIGDLFNDSTFVFTPQNDFLEKNPPNVIFLQMESLSEEYFELSTEEFDLIGELKEELPDLYYYKNSLASMNGTIYSLEALTVGTPTFILSQSRYYKVPFKSSIALPFKTKGYKTVFVTGAQESWRNVNGFLVHQGFDDIEGKHTILQKYPEAETFIWGVHDEYMFKYIEDYLKENAKQPNFIYGMSISNHSPYEIPKSFKPRSIKIPSALKKRFRVNEKVAIENFVMHQYSATQLARFIQRIKNSPLGGNTIIVATGDHNTRMVLTYTQENQFLEVAVPTIMYIPEKYKPKWSDLSVMMSHKDIFPTIFNLSLSDTPYFYTGDDLFNPNVKYRFALNSFHLLADSIGVMTANDYSPKAFQYFIWKDEAKRKLESGDNKSEHALWMNEKNRAFYTMGMMRIYKDILNEKNKD